MSKVTVIIPTYNGARFIGEALESVFAQTQPPEEIIVVDDASTDGTPELVEQIANGSPVPLRLIPMKKNSGGPARPLNIGFREAKSDVIAILEQDDQAVPDRLERELAALELFPQASLVTGRVVMNAGGRDADMPPWFKRPDLGVAGICALKAEKDMFLFERKAAFRALLQDNFLVTNSTICLRRRTWTKAGGFDEGLRVASDLDFGFRGTALGPVAVVNSDVCIHRWTPTSLNQSQVTARDIEGPLVRLKWALKAGEWTNAEFFEQYWILRRLAREARRSGRLGEALKIWRTLLVCGAMWRHARQKIVAVFPKTWRSHD